ncbi:hypothetical protein CathTA2_1449 [Caldalkalibacillus thermarum TA2.A1]|uniref:Binding-protein-dependent transport systems inner membrane component n=1 Tax=Caldalkalibacillus thermarum (strain TA2.A1) TaxID=986075 RepID=F5L6J9_CALTT|nr:hypothetical protein CathTA2_1449 [Caldalkalibacillus thermarum TA2.A1]
MLAGYYGGWVDMLISRLFDIMLAFPAILLAIAIVAILGPSLENALIGPTAWLPLLSKPRWGLAQPSWKRLPLVFWV